MINAGIIGLGRIVTDKKLDLGLPTFWYPYSIYEGLTTQSLFQVKGFFDLEKKSFMGLDQFESFEEFKKSNCELGVIATRGAARIEILKKMQEIEIKNFHLEKPICLRADELQYLWEEIDKNRIFFTTGLIRRYLNPFQFLKQIVKESLSSLKKVKMTGKPQELFWNFVHYLDLLFYILGPIFSVRVKNVELCNLIFERKIFIRDPIIHKITLVINNEWIFEFCDTQNSSSIQFIFEDQIITCFGDCEMIEIQNTKTKVRNLYPPIEEPGGFFNVFKQMKLALEGDFHATEFVKTAMTEAIHVHKLLFEIIAFAHNEKNFKCEKLKWNEVICLALNEKNHGA